MRNGDQVTWSDFIRWYARDPMLLRMLFSIFSRKKVRFLTRNATTSNTAQTTDSSFPLESDEGEQIDDSTSLIRNQVDSSYFRTFVTGRAVPLELQVDIDAINRSRSFLEGATFFTDTLWPITLAGILLHDIYQFIADPTNRYDNTIFDIFTGFSNNGETYGSMFGDYLPTDGVAYWLPPALLLTSPLIFGFGNMLLNWKRSNPNSLADIINNPDAALEGGNFFPWIYPSAVRRNFNALEFSLLWGNMSNENRAFILSKIINMIHNGNSLARLYSIRALVRFVDGFHRDRIKNSNLLHLNSDLRDHLETLASEKLQDIIKLSEVDPKKNTKIVGPAYRIFIINYLLWSHGIFPNDDQVNLPIRFLVSLIFWTLATYKWYARYRFFQILVRKILDAVLYLQSKKNCESKGEDYSYIAELGDYICSVCGSEDYPYLGNIYSSQSCLDSLLAKDRPAKYILEKIKPLLKSNNITRLDLSRQNWQSWDEQDFSDLFYLIESANINITHINLGKDVKNTNKISSEKLNRISKALMTFSLDVFSIQNLGLNGDEFELIEPGLKKQARMKSLGLSGNMLTDSNIENLSNSTMAENLISLDVSNNKLTDGCSESLMRFSFLDVLNVSYNEFQGNILDIIAGYLPKSSLEIIDFSGNDFSTASLAKFSVAQKNSSLISVSFDGCALNSIQLNRYGEALKEAHTKKISLNNNNIQNTVIVEFVDDFSESRAARSIAIEGNQLQSSGLSGLTSIFNRSQIDKVSLGNNLYSPSALNYFLPGLSSTLVKTLILKNQVITKDNLDALASVISRTHLEKIIFKNCKIPDGAMDALFEALPSSNVAWLILSNNKIGDQSFAKLVNIIELTKLEVLILRDNQITAKSAASLPAKLSQTRLRVLDLSGNQVKEVGVTLAEHLIEPIPNIEKIADSAIDRDFARTLAKAKPRTKLTNLQLERSGLGEREARALCRVIPLTLIVMNNFNINNNSAAATVDPTNCRIKAEMSSTRSTEVRSENNNTAQMILAGAIPIFGTILLLFLFYKLLTRYFEPQFNSSDIFSKSPSNSAKDKSNTNSSKEEKGYNL